MNEVRVEGRPPIKGTLGQGENREFSLINGNGLGSWIGTSPGIPKQWYIPNRRYGIFFQDTEKISQPHFFVRYFFYTVLHLFTFFLQNIVKLSQNTADITGITGITGIETGKE